MRTFASIRKHSSLFIVITDNTNKIDPRIIEFMVETVYRSSDNKVVIRTSNGVKANFNPNSSAAYLTSKNSTQHIFTEKARAEEFFKSLTK